MEGSEARRVAGMVGEQILDVGEAGKEWKKALVLLVEWFVPLAFGSYWSGVGDWRRGCLELE